jgi:ATP-binding cassette subfamily B (MDR/TAP) protein 1
MAAAAPGTARDGETARKEEVGVDHGKRVSFTGMLRYADGTDLLLMLVGTAAALGNGVSQPLMTIIFGDLIDAFGGATTGNVLDRVNKVIPSLCPPPFRPARLASSRPRPSLSRESSGRCLLTISV